MTDAYETGTVYSSALPAWQRTYYEGILQETLRTKSILVPYSIPKEDFKAVNTKQIVYSEVYDLEPNWNATSESTIWKKGMYLDSRTVSLDLNWYHDVIKYSDHMDTVTYLNGGDTSGIVRNKLGFAMAETMDILARNAYLAHPNKLFGGNATSRATLDAADIFDIAACSKIRVQLQENEIPGINSNDPNMQQQILCITTPRVIYDVKTAAGNKWKEYQEYAGATRIFSGEVGMYDGVRFLTTNRLKLRNHGAAVQQTQLNGATVEGQGAKAVVDSIYAPGQSTSTRYITVDSTTGFAAGDNITIHTESLGTTVLESDGFQETREIAEVIDGTTMSLDKPLLKAHDNNSYVTKAIDVNVSIFLGGPAVVYGVAERPNVIVPPKYDDAMLVNRIGWRGMFKFQMFRPEWFRVVESAGSAV